MVGRACFVPAVLAVGLGACAHDESSVEDLYERTRLELRRGFLHDSLRLAEQGLGANDALSEMHLRFRLLKAETLLAMGRTEEAANLLKAASPPRPAQDSIEARRLILLGQATHGFLPSSSHELQEILSSAHEKAERAASPALLAEVEWRQGYALSLEGQPDSAVTLLKSALTKAQEAGDKFLEATILGNLGVIYRDQGRFDEGVPWFRESLDVAREAGAIRTAAAVRQSLGVCYNRLGEFEQARQMITRAAEASAKLGDAAIEQNCLASLGNLHYDRGDYKLAAELFEKALSLARESGDQLRESRWLNNLAAALLALGDLDAAERNNEQSLTLKRRLGEDPGYPLLHRAQIAAARRRFEPAARMFRELAAQSDEQRNVAIRWEAQAGLAGVYRATGRLEEARQSFLRTLEEIDEARHGLQSEEFQPGFQERAFRFYRDYVAFLLERGETVAALEAAESARAKVMRDRLRVDGAEVPVNAVHFQRLAGRMDAVLLSYWLAPERSVVWAVTSDAVTMRDLSTGVDELEALIESHRNAIQSQRDLIGTGHSAGRRLFDSLIGPVQDVISRGGRVVVVPDGPLYGLNLETLIAGSDEAPHYWIEDVSPILVPSLSVLETTDRNPRSRSSILVIGDPLPATKKYPRIDHAAAELDSIQKHFHRREISVLEGRWAHPAAYAPAKPGSFAMIHFAAHAEANSQSPLESAIILSPLAGSYKLYAQDVMQVPIHAELVTISACHSAGIRRYAGEGLIGFAWAFLYAGASNVIAGLWEAPDRATARLMDILYRKLAAGADPAEALRASKLALLHSRGAYKKPYYWAPFQVYTRSGVRRDLHLTNK